MKRLLALLLLLPLAAWGDDKINIAVPALLTGDAVISRQPLTLTPTSPLPRTYYTNVFSRQPVSRATDANGLVTFSNIVWGYYRLDIPGNPGTSFGLVVGTNLSGTVNVVTLITNTASVPPNPSTNYLTEAQSDARYATIGGGGGGGSATNIFFISGQNTTAAQIGGSNTFHVTGVLTNSTLGNAATATDAAFATEATRASGLLDLDSLDAVTTTLTKIVATSGHDYLGGGSGLTNIPSLWVASISVLTNLPNVADGVVGYVDSYFGTNVWGGGKFKRSTGSSATINNGTVFAANGSGRWLRVDTGYPTNFFFMEHFGVVPDAALDQYTAAQSTINASPTTAGAVILPPYGFGTATTLTYTNRRGCYFGALGGGLTVNPGYRTYPNPLSIIHWVGATGGTNLIAYDVGHTTFARFGLDTRKGVNDGTQWSAAAGLLLDVDMNAVHTTTTSANVFDGLYFRERGTNVNLVGLRIANAGVDNCEFFRLENCYFQGSGGNCPDYWVNSTNLGAAKAIQLGGAGGGGDSFGHKMVNCGFNLWQHFLYSDGGSWDIEANYGTAAGVVAYYINGVKGSYIRGVEDEGDRMFLQSPSVHPVILEANRIAWASTSVSNIAQVDGVNLVLLGNTWNTDSSNLMPAVTNSFNNTGRYFGRNNTMPQTNTTAIASWRFASSFDSAGDFGTISDNNRIQSFPARTVSLLGQTNPVWAAWTDSATFPVLTLMPSNGAVAINGYINNVIASVWNPDPLNKTSWQVGDEYKNPRVRIIPAANTTTLEASANQGAYLKVQSSNAVVNLVSGNGVNTLNFNRGYGLITGTNDTELARFGNGGLDFKIKFPYDTNFEVVGTMQAKALHLTNLAQGASSALLGWSDSTKAVTTQSVTVAGSQIILTGTDGKLLYNNAGGVDFADWDTVNNQGGTLTTNNNTLLGGGFVMTGNGARGVTNLSVGAGLVVENGVLKTNGETTGGGGGSQTPWTSDINAANYKLTNLNYASFSGGVVLDKDGARNNGYVGSVVTAIGGRSNLVQGSASSVDNVVLEGRSNVFNIQSSVAVGNAIIAGSSNLLNNPALATVRNSVILGGHGNNIQGASDALAAGSGSVVQSGHNGTFVLSDSQNTATLSQSSDTLLLRFQNGVGINTNNPGTNALFVVGSQTVTSNLNVSGTITGGGSIIANGANITNINSTNIVFHFTTLPTLTTNTLVVKNGETYIDADYNVAVTNIIIAGQRETLVVSNHSAATIAAFVTTASRKIGSVTSNGIQIAAGKFGYLSFDVNSGKWTNYAAAVEP